MLPNCDDLPFSRFDEEEVDEANTSWPFDPLEKDITCALYDFLIEAVFMGLLCFFGFFGNLLSAICLWKDKSKSATPFLLISLEIADTFFLVTVLLLRVLTSIHEFTERPIIMHTLTPYFGKYVYPLAMVANTGTVYLTVLVTVNRYISVCKPYEASSLCSIRNARKQVVIVWIFSIVFNIPRFFEYDIEDCVKYELLTSQSPTMSAEYKEVERIRIMPTWLSLNQIYQLVYANILYCLIMFFVPLLSLIVLNYNLIKALRETRRKRENMRIRRNVDPSSATLGKNINISSRSEDDITLMLIVVVVIFVVSQSPAMVTQILMAFLRSSDYQLACPDSFFFFHERISDLLVVTNSSVNFIAYCFCSRRFRKILISLLWRRNPEAESADVAPETAVHTVDPVKTVVVRNDGHRAQEDQSSQTCDNNTNSCLHIMTKRNPAKCRSYEMQDMKEANEGKPIVDVP